MEVGISLSISILDNNSTKSSSFLIGILLSFAIFIILFAVSPFPFAVIFGVLFAFLSYCNATAFCAF